MIVKRIREAGAERENATVAEEGQLIGKQKTKGWKKRKVREKRESKVN